jgi:AcrR family transcriptional regulator
MQAVLDAVAERLLDGDESLIRIPEICEATGVNYGSVYHHFGSREGLIDAAYNMLFSRLSEKDIETFDQIQDSIETLDEYMALVYPVIASVNSGPERLARRAMRVRVVAAAATRPELLTMIGETQAHLTAEWRRLIEFAQKRDWLRDDVPPEVLSVLFQALVFGRALDDVSATPIDETLWEQGTATLFLSLLKIPSSDDQQHSVAE